jgi:hypothetical protein
MTTGSQAAACRVRTPAIKVSAIRINMSQSLVTLLVVAFSVGNSFAEDELKQFLNIRAPKTALNAPIVFSLNGKATLFGLYYRDGKRDVSAMQLDGDEWRPLGENGLEITGVDGNFLSDIAIDAHGTPWLLTYYTRPSNSDRADRFYLYTIRDDRWISIGPKDGHKANFSGSEALCLLDGKTPVLVYRTWNRQTKTEKHRVFVLRDDAWCESALGDRIPDDCSVLVNDKRIIVVQPRNARVLLFELTDVEGPKLPEPRYTVDLPNDRHYGSLYFNGGILSAMQLYDSDSQSFLVRFTDKNNKVAMQDLPNPDDHLIIAIRWTRDNEMLVATNDRKTARVYRLKNGTNWEIVANAKETSGGFLDFASFSVLDDGTPIVTWEAFFAR